MHGGGHFSLCVAVQCDLTSACQGHCVGIQEVKHTLCRLCVALGTSLAEMGSTQRCSLTSPCFPPSRLALCFGFGQFFPQMKLNAWEAVGDLHDFSTSANKTATWPFCLMANWCFHLTKNPNPKRFVIFAFMIYWLGIRNVGIFVVWQGFKPVI